MKRLRIMIVDDCPTICKALSDRLNTVPEFEVIKTITDPSIAVEEVLVSMPDILLLDAVMPSLDGDDILEALREKLSFALGIIIISPINNDMTIRHYSSLGAHYFIPKPVNCEKLIKKIKRLNENLQYEQNVFKTSDPDDDSYIYSHGSAERPILSKITKVLIKTGINPKLKGFCFLKESILFICISGNELSSVTKIVYPKIAKDFGTASEKVERSIRTAIEKAFNSENGGKYYYDTFGPHRSRKSTKQYPSNREFIYTVAEYVKNIDTTDLIC